MNSDLEFLEQCQYSPKNPMSASEYVFSCYLLGLIWTLEKEAIRGGKSPTCRHTQIGWSSSNHITIHPHSYSMAIDVPNAIDPHRNVTSKCSTQISPGTPPGYWGQGQSHPMWVKEPWVSQTVQRRHGPGTDRSRSSKPLEVKALHLERWKNAGCKQEKRPSTMETIINQWIDSRDYSINHLL